MFVLGVRNNTNPKAIEASIILSAYLDSLGLESAFVDSSALYNGADLEDCGLKDTKIDMAVVLGGDGTILHTARLLQGQDASILGINFGNVGFLANEGELGVLELVSEALAGELIESRRANLQIEVFCEHVQDACDEEASKEEGTNGNIGNRGEGPSIDVCSDVELVEAEDGTYRLRKPFFALNEVVVTRGSLGRIIDYSLNISGVHIADVSGDGVIVSTSTGSTAYSLAAGGPIVHPSIDGMIVQPLAPHTLTARAILTNPQDIVSIDLTDIRNGREATLFIDGDAPELPSRLLEIRVRKGSVPTRLLYHDGEHFYKYCESNFFAG